MHAARVRRFSFLRRLKSGLFIVVVVVIVIIIVVVVFFFLHSQSLSKHLSFSHLRLPSFFFQFAFEFPGGFLPSLVLPLPEPGDEVHAIGVRERRDPANERFIIIIIIIIIIKVVFVFVVVSSSTSGRFGRRLLLLLRRRRRLPRLSSGHHETNVKDGL